MLGVWTGFIERKKENETHSHMFLYTCEYDDVVWSCAMQWMNMNINLTMTVYFAICPYSLQ